MAGEETVVLGLDPGTRCTGWGIVVERSGVARLVAAGTLRPSPKAPMDVRLGHIFAGLARLIAEHKPHEAALESSFSARNAATAIKLGQARGAAMAACAQAGIRVRDYEPSKVKKSLVGQGRAEKSQVAFMVGQVLGVKPDWAEDASDALAVAICHLNHRRLARLTA
jgi:crossover junction endodeoxyribonuclease RuvC